MLSMKEYAALVGVSYQTIRKLILAGKLPYVKIGRQVRIDPDEVKRRQRQEQEAQEELRRERERLKAYANKGIRIKTKADYLAALKALV